MTLENMLSEVKEARHKRPHIVWYLLKEMSKIGIKVETERLVVY